MKRFQCDITCCVPYGDVIRTPLFHIKGPSDCAEGFFEFPLHVPVEQRGLPHVHVSEENYLDIGFLHLRQLRHDDDDDDESLTRRAFLFLIPSCCHKTRSRLIIRKYYREKFEKRHFIKKR